MAVTHDASTAVLRPEIDVATQERCHLGLRGLGQKGSRPDSQYFGQRVFERPWLNQLDNGIVGHGYHSFVGEVEASNAPTIRRLHPFTPPPTSAHTSP